MDSLTLLGRYEVADVEAPQSVLWPRLDTSPLQPEDDGDSVAALGVRRVLRDGSDVLRSARSWLQQHPPATPRADPRHVASVQPSSRTSTVRSLATTSSSLKSRPPRVEARRGEQGVRHGSRSHRERSSGRHNETRSRAPAASSRRATSHELRTTKKVVFQEINQQQSADYPDTRSSISPSLTATAGPLPASPRTFDSRHSTSPTLESVDQRQVEDTPRLHTQTLQPVTIRRTLVHQSGPQVGISPHPLQLRSSNVFVELQAAVETEPTPLLCTNLMETSTQTSPEVISSPNNQQQQVSNRLSFLASKVTFETATQTPSTLRSVLHTAVQTENISILVAPPRNTTADPEPLIASRVHQPTSILLPVITVAVQTDELCKEEAETDISQLRSTDQITSSDPLLASPSKESQLSPDVDVIRRHSPLLSSSVPTVSVPAKNVSHLSNFTMEKKMIPQPIPQDPEILPHVTATNTQFTPATEKQFTKPSNVSPRLLSPILEQNSSSENSPPDVMSPVVVAKETPVTLNAGLVQITVPSQPADTQGSTSEPGGILQPDGTLPLLSLGIRGHYMKGSHIHQVSEQTMVQCDPSSTFSSLAESDHSSADTSDTSSLSTVEGAEPGSEGELLPARDDVTVSSVVIEPEDVLGSDDTLSGESSTPASRADWSRSSCSVGEVCVIPAAQRRRVLYLASRVAPQLLAGSTGSRSEGELSEGQVWPWPPRDLLLQRQ